MIERKNKILLPAASAVIAFFAALLILLCARTASAAVVYPSSNTDRTDRANIQNELDSSGEATLVSGETYYLSGSLTIKSGDTINADGAEIICSGPIMFNIPGKTNYASLNGFTLNGGTWVSEDENGYDGSSIKITHGQNIKILNATIRHANAAGHSIELVACKNAEISGCEISPLGSFSSKTEEAVQLDIATHTTAYFLESPPFNTAIAKQLQNGAPCQNITIKNCSITGNRGVVANYTSKEKGKYLNRLHSNIVLENNKITGLKGEGVALFNTKSATVKNNTIISKAGGSSSAYTVGLHFGNFSRGSNLKKGKIIVSDNTIKGGRQAMQVYSHTSAKYGSVSIKSNRLYCKKGKKAALKAYKKQCKSLKTKSNKAYKWNGK